MKQLKDLQVSKRGRSSNNPEDDCQLLSEQQIDQIIDGFDGDLKTKADVLAQSDTIAEFLTADNLSDFRDYVVDDKILAQVYPYASAERIEKERQLQTSHYVLKKFIDFIGPL